WASTFARAGVDAAVTTHDALGAIPADGAPSLLVVDEAHRFANRATRRHRRLAEIRPESLLLVTATPLANALDELLALVRLAVADDALKPWGHPSIEYAFARRDASAIRSIVALVSVRRDAIPHLDLPARRRSTVRFPVSSREAEVRRGLEDLRFPAIAVAGEAAILRDHLWRRLESSPEAFVHSLERQRRFYRRAREKLAAGFSLTRRDFAALFERDERDLFQELLFPEVFLEPAEGGEPVAAAIDRELLAVEHLLRIARAEPPSKRSLLEALFGDDRLLPAVVFTRALATADALFASLAPTRRTALLSSRSILLPDAVPCPIETLLAVFRARRIDVLVLTDMAAEGLDLQAAASVVHFDLPWTEVRLAQRNGRSCRLGQVRPEVRCFYFLPAGRVWRSTLTYVARKERLARRYLAGEPFDEEPLRGAIPVQLVVELDRGDLLVNAAGVPLLVRAGRFTADPLALRPLQDALVGEDALARWADLRRQAEAIPSRRAGRGSLP
ncbi:MAG: helicase-related protein, partial [Thermoanaerobaculia bacterium]